MTGEKRSVSGAIGVVDVVGLMRDITSVQAKSYDWPACLDDLLLLIDSLNMTFSILNLILPLPLDDGCSVDAIFERLR